MALCSQSSVPDSSTPTPTPRRQTPSAENCYSTTRMHAPELGALERRESKRQRLDPGGPRAGGGSQTGHCATAQPDQRCVVRRVVRLFTHLLGCPAAGHSRLFPRWQRTNGLCLLAGSRAGGRAEPGSGVRHQRPPAAAASALGVAGAETVRQLSPGAAAAHVRPAWRSSTACTLGVRVCATFERRA